MRMDVQNELSSSQAFTGAATVSTNSYQKQTALQDISIGRRMAIFVYFHLAGAGTTHTLSAIQADSADLATNKNIVNSVSVATAALPAEMFVEVPIPQGVLNQQFVGLQHSAAGGTTTATLSAWLMPQDEISKYKTFPKVSGFGI